LYREIKYFTYDLNDRPTVSQLADQYLFRLARYCVSAGRPISVQAGKILCLSWQTNICSGWQDIEEAALTHFGRDIKKAPFYLHSEIISSNLNSNAVSC
jgi:hypothetical protein